MKKYIINRHEGGQHKLSPPNEAATATEPATDPAALATAAKPLAPITGTRAPNVGPRAPKPAAIAGAAKPVEYEATNKMFAAIF